MKRLAVLPLAALLLTACQDTPTGTPEPPLLDIQDAAHNDGNSHFFFLPPITSQPEIAGVFDATLSPVVEVSRMLNTGEETVATFAMGTDAGSETVRIENEHYIVNWHTNDYGVLPGETYRIHVFVAGTPLGFADVVIADNGKEAKSLTTSETFALVDGRTLPIKFRIEEGAVSPIGPDGGTVDLFDGAVRLEIEPGALPSAVGITISVLPDLPSDYGILPGAVWSFEPDGLEFNIPARLIVSVASLGDISDPETLTLVTELDDGSWLEVPTIYDAQIGSLVGLVEGFSSWAVAIKGADITISALPADFVGDQCDVSGDDWLGRPIVQKCVLSPGQHFTLYATVTDAGGNRLSARALEWFAGGDPPIFYPSGGQCWLDQDNQPICVGTHKSVYLYPDVVGVESINVKSPHHVVCPASICDNVHYLTWSIPIEAPRVNHVAVEPSVLELAVGETAELVASLYDANGTVLPVDGSFYGREVNWESSHPTVATVDGGLVEGVASGTAVVTATWQVGQLLASGSAAVTVGQATPTVWDHWYLETRDDYPLFEVWGNNPTDVFAVGDSGFVHHFDGTSWTRQYLDLILHTGDKIASTRALTGTSNGDVWLAGTVILADGRTRFFVQRHNGISWNGGGSAGHASEFRWTPNGIWIGPYTGLIAGYTKEGGTIYYNDALSQGWDPQYYGGLNDGGTIGEGSPLQDVWMSADESQRFAVGNVGTVLTFVQDKWETVVLPAEIPEADFNSIWEAPNGDLIVAGSKNTILSYDGNVWTAFQMPVPTGVVDTERVEYYGLHGLTNDDIWAVGFEWGTYVGVVMRFDGEAWESVETGISATYRDVWVSETDVFLVGRGGNENRGIALRGTR